MSLLKKLNKLPQRVIFPGETYIRFLSIEKDDSSGEDRWVIFYHGKERGEKILGETFSGWGDKSLENATDMANNYISKIAII